MSNLLLFTLILITKITLKSTILYREGIKTVLSMMFSGLTCRVLKITLTHW